MKQITKYYLYLTPLVASTIASISSIIFFFIHYGGIKKFIEMNKNADGSLMAFFLIFFVIIVANTIGSLLSLFIFLRKGAIKQ